MKEHQDNVVRYLPIRIKDKLKHRLTAEQYNQLIKNAKSVLEDQLINLTEPHDSFDKMASTAVDEVLKLNFQKTVTGRDGICVVPIRNTILAAVIIILKSSDSPKFWIWDFKDAIVKSDYTYVRLR